MSKRCLLLLYFFFLSCSVQAQLSLSHSLFAAASEPIEGLSNSTELNYMLISGNTRSSNFNFKQQTAYRWETQTLLARMSYLHASANDINNAQNWATEMRYERRLKPHWGAFIGESLQGDIFAGYRQRYSSDLGLRRTLWSTPTTKGTAELGYEYQRENRNNGDRDTRQLIRLFGETSYRFEATDAVGLISAELLPNLKDPSDWLMNIEASLQTEITQLLSLKVASLVKVAHKPPTPTTQKVDATWTTGFVLKF